MKNTNKNKIIHKHSNEIVDGLPKLPQPSDIDYAEIAINYAKDSETISLKNDANEIIEFKSKDYFEKIITDNELVTAKAINDINIKIGELSNNDDLSELKEAVNKNTEQIEENSLVTTSALVDLDKRINDLGFDLSSIDLSEYAKNDAVESQINTISLDFDNKINLINGDDAGKSMRVVATEVISGISDDVDSALESLENLKNWKDTHGDEYESVINNIETLNNTTETLTEDTNSLKTTTNNIENRISTLENTSSELDGRIDTLEIKSSELSSKIQSLESVDTGLDNRINALETTSSELSSKVQSLESVNTELDGRIDTLETTSSELSSKVQSLESVDTELDGRIDTLESAINKAGTVDVVNVSEQTISIEPNKYYVFTNPMDNINIDFVIPTDNTIVNHYMVEFTSSTNNCTLVLPDDIIWFKNITPIIEPNKTYQLSVINNLGVIISYNR